MDWPSDWLIAAGWSLELIGILSIAVPDLLRGERFSAWLTARYEAAMTVLRRIFKRTQHVTGTSSLTLDAKVTSGGRVDRQVVLNPNATDAERIDFLFSRFEEIQAAVEDLQGRLAMTSKVTDERLTAVQTDVTAHFQEALKAGLEQYRGLRIAGTAFLVGGVFCVILGTVLS